MMETQKIDAIYFRLHRKPWCFAVRRKLQSGHDDFEFVKVSSLPELLTNLFALLNAVCSDFVARLEKLDKERMKISSHRTVPYFDANHAPKWRKCFPVTIGRFEARAISVLACRAARVDHESINSPLLSVLDE